MQNVQGSTASTQGVGEFQGYAAYVPTDYTTFQTNVGEKLTNPTIVGPFNPSGGLESALDIEYIAAVGVGNANWYWTEESWMYQFAVAFVAAAARPAVFSMSYAWSEQDQVRPWLPLAVCVRVPACLSTFADRGAVLTSAYARACVCVNMCPPAVRRERVR